MYSALRSLFLNNFIKRFVNKLYYYYAYQVTEMLLDSGSDMEAVERVKKRTALHAAVECRLPGSQLVVGDSEAALMLIDRGV